MIRHSINYSIIHADIVVVLQLITHTYFLILWRILQTSCTSKNGVCLQKTPLKASKIKASQRGGLQEVLALRGIETTTECMFRYVLSRYRKYQPFGALRRSIQIFPDFLFWLQEVLALRGIETLQKTIIKSPLKVTGSISPTMNHPWRYAREKR